MKTKVTFLTAIAIALSTVFCLIQAPPASADTTVILAQGKCGGLCGTGTLNVSSCSRIRLVIEPPYYSKAKVVYQIFDLVTGENVISQGTCNDNSTTCTDELELPGTSIDLIMAVTGETLSYALFCRQSGGGT